ncbi:MAG TPA: FtsX-like permease family protein [Gemmatimonadales bacterium]|nr:FtsX-like permease family protein [Gemmatimonadales bacterium]
MTGLAFIARMAGRELKAAPRRMALLMGTIAVGVAALVAIRSFTDNLRSSVQQQARALLGADLSFSARQEPSRRVEALLDTLGRRAELARVTSFAGMAYVPRTSGARLVQVAAVAGRYPFYGEIATQPRAAWRDLQAGRHVIVDPTLLTALNARLGDTLVLGEARFAITGTIQSAPSEVGFRFAVGPRIYIAAQHLGATNLLGFGARVQYEIFAKLPSDVSAQQQADRYRKLLASERVRVRTVADDQRNLNEVLSKLAGYLGLLALMALLLSAVGVASAAVVFVRQRSESVAMLRCLGATAGQTFGIYLAEAAIMSLVGSAAGALIGVLLQRVLPALLQGLIPVEVTPTLSWPAIGLGVGMGVWVALIATLLPLLSVRSISPMQALRRPYQPIRTRRDAWWVGASVALAVSALLLSVYQVGSWRQGALFTAGVALTIAVLWITAVALTRLMRRRIPEQWPYVWKQGLANLYRPANQTATLILAVGFGAFLLGTLYLVQHNLLHQLRSTGGPARPNLVLFDIQPDQFSAIAREVSEAGLPLMGPTPIVPMRIRSVKGRPVSNLLSAGVGREGPPGAWALRREYRSTYRDSIVASERIVEGTWTRAAPAVPARISIEQELARDLDVTVGDEIVWDVQGVSLPSRVTSVREVDWARFEPNFFVVFAPGTLDRAPQTLVALTRIVDPGKRGAFQRQIAERFPNVSALDLSLLQEALERLVSRVALAVRFMALFSIGVGILVLVGALATSRFQRIREGALLRTLGATRSQIFTVVVAEYLALGLFASVVAILLAIAAGWALARFVFEGSFSLPAVPLAGLVFGVIALTVLVGLANSREVVRRTPLEVLREQ